MPKPGGDPPSPDHPVSLRDAWRTACWSGDAMTEQGVLQRWRDISSHWIARAHAEDARVDDDTWSAAIDLERAARWPAVRDRRAADTASLLRDLVLLGTRHRDPVEVQLTQQAAATDRLRSLTHFDTDLLATVERVARECADGTAEQQARACLNAAWATRRYHHQHSRRWARQGLERLGPVDATANCQRRELALHLLQQAGAFLPASEQVILAKSMLALLARREYPAWQARILLRRWAAQMDDDPATATASLDQAVGAAARSLRGRTIWEIGSQVALGATMGDLPEQTAVQHLERLLVASESSGDPLVPSHIRGFLVEQLCATNAYHRADELGSRALADLEWLAGEELMVEGRAVAAPECLRMWASLARPVANARVRLGVAASGAALLRRSMQIYADACADGQAALTALELAEVCQGMDATEDAIAALRDAVVFAGRKGDRDLQARAYSAMPAVIWAGEGALAALSACDSSEQAIYGLLREVDTAPNEEFADPADRALERGLVMWEALELKRSRAEILAGAGGLPQAIAALDGVDVEFLDTGYVAQATEVLVTRGRYLAALDRADEATATWERAARLAHAKELGWMVRDVVAAWAGWLTERGDHAQAELIRRRWLDDADG